MEWSHRSRLLKFSLRNLCSEVSSRILSESSDLPIKDSGKRGHRWEVPGGMTPRIWWKTGSRRIIHIADKCGVRRE
ncbi:hypothetical protein J6590_077235 [Homalodisca vitripennis]|nr:hypothetical protein J6590_077235 [Homalodisca vitripennis]